MSVFKRENIINVKIAKDRQIKFIKILLVTKVLGLWGVIFTCCSSDWGIAFVLLV